MSQYQHFQPIISSSRGRGARTPVYGFGDRRTTTVLFPCTNESYYIIETNAKASKKIFFSALFLLAVCGTQSLKLRPQNHCFSLHKIVK